MVLEDCTGTFYITDIMFQEGEWLTGYVVNNLELLQKKRVDGEITPVRFFNGLVRSGVTAVIINVFFVKHFSLKKASEFPVFSEGFSLL